MELEDATISDIAEELRKRGEPCLLCWTQTHDGGDAEAIVAFIGGRVIVVGLAYQALHVITHSGEHTKRDF